MDYFPLFLNLKVQNCLIIGAGEVAARKIDLLVRSAAIIQQGTTANQRIMTGTLESLPRKVAKEGIKAPTLIIVGTVVTLHDKLDWFKAS